MMVRHTYVYDWVMNTLYVCNIYDELYQYIRHTELCEISFVLHHDFIQQMYCVSSGRPKICAPDLRFVVLCWGLIPFKICHWHWSSQMPQCKCMDIGLWINLIYKEVIISAQRTTKPCAHFKEVFSILDTSWAIQFIFFSSNLSSLLAYHTTKIMCGSIRFILFHVIIAFFPCIYFPIDETKWSFTSKKNMPFTITGYGCHQVLQCLVDILWSIFIQHWWTVCRHITNHKPLLYI